MKASRKLLAFIALLLVSLSTPLALPRAGAVTGLVCIADPSANPSSCPSSAVSFSGTSGAILNLAVNIQGSDTVNGFDISTLVDPAVLQPLSISSNNSIIHSPSFVATQTVDPSSGLVRFAIVALGYTIPGPVTGNLFNIAYRVLTSAQGTGIVFETGCSGTSVPNTCVTVTSPNTDSETVQNGSLAGPVTPSFTLSASNQNPQTVTAGSSTSSTISVNSLNGFSGTVNLNTSPPPLCASCPTWGINPASVSLVSGGAASAVVIFSTTSGTPPNTYNVVVNGTSGFLSHVLLLSFKVNSSSPSDFSISAKPASQNVLSGSNVTSLITLTSLNGFSGTISLATTPRLACPLCPQWSISPTSISLPSGAAGSSTLTFASSAGGPTGTFDVNVTGSSGSLSHSTMVLFTVTSTPLKGTVCIAPSTLNTCPSQPAMLQGTVGGILQIAVNVQNSSALNGFDIQVLTDPTILRPLNDSLGGTVLQNVLVVANSVNPTNGLVRVAAVQQGGVTVAPTTGRLFFIEYNITRSTSGSFILFPTGCSGTSNDSVCVTITNPNIPGGIAPENILEANFTSPVPADFTLSANPSSLAIPAGTAANSTITITSINGFSGTVSLHTSSPPLIICPPSCSRWTISPASVTLSPGGIAKAVLQIVVSSFGNGGSGSTITVFGTGGTLSHTTQVIFAVIPPPPTFSLTSNPSSIVIHVGQSGSSILTITSLNGFNGTISLSASITPVFAKKNPTISLAPTSITLTSGGTATATLSISSNGGTPTGTFNVTVTATIGSITQTTTLTVTVVPRH